MKILFLLILFVNLLCEEHIGKVFNGDVFHKLFKKRFVKLTKKEGDHNSIVYKEGFIKDVNEFSPYGECSSGGLYFTEFEKFPMWTYFRFEPMYYMWDVSIPKNCSVYVEVDKFKASCFYIKNKTEKIYSAAVKQDG